MLYAVPAHIELIIRDNILGEVILARIICAKFTLNRFLGCKQISHLNIELLILLLYSNGSGISAFYESTKKAIKRGRSDLPPVFAYKEC